ncbi:Ohr family peroxiredoxin [uncultured Sphingomonas sp.]|uniref:Ohr family peroxiredoxin n=1 Tax=unclassified Sphingomonas TaxID=196159 RepID=UPI0025E61ED2|nr:Ohr family peroxiredoxin [uncultured Sphingomonas sp.]
MSNDIIYRATATVLDAHTGTAATEDGALEVLLTGPGTPGTNAEQLFATGYAACFLTSLQRVATQRRVTLVAGTLVTATIGITQPYLGGFPLKATILATMPTIDRTMAEQLVAAAYEICPYSTATRGNIDVALDVA